MNDIKIYSITAVGLLAVMYALFFMGLLSPVPALGFILGTSGVLLGWVSLKLTFVWNSLNQEQKMRMSVLNELRWFFITGSIFLFVDLIPHVFLVIFYPVESTITIAHWMAHTILFVNTVLGARVAVSLFNPQYKNVVASFVAFIGITALGASIVYPDHLINIPGSQYPLLSSNYVYAWFNQIANISSLGFAGIYLIIQGLRSPSHIAKVRASLLGVGAIFFVAVGYFVHFVHTWYVPLAIYTSFIGYALFMGIGALYAAGKKEEMIVPNPAGTNL